MVWGLLPGEVHFELKDNGAIGEGDLGSKEKKRNELRRILTARLNLRHSLSECLYRLLCCI